MNSSGGTRAAGGASAVTQTSAGATSAMTIGSGGASEIGAGPTPNEIGAGGAPPCIDTANDPLNCGSCLNVCGTVKLATGQGPGSIAVDATSVYWANAVANPGMNSNESTLMKVSREGGKPITLASSHQLGPIAVDATSVYFISDDKVMKVSTSGGTPTVLASNQNAFAIALDRDSVYWTTFSSPGCPDDGGPCRPDGAVMKASIAGGTPEMLASHLDYPGQIAVDATNVYWTSPGGNIMNGAVFRVPRDGGAPVALASHKWGVGEGIAISTTNVYWVQTSQADGGGGDALVTMPILGGPITELARVTARSLATDRAYIYFVDQYRIMRMPLHGGTPVQLAGGANMQPGDLAVDATNVYWSNLLPYDGSVMTLNAPTCGDGQCKCPAEQSLCFGTCVDLKADPMNCGACGTACGDGVVCVNGHCGV